MPEQQELRGRWHGFPSWIEWLKAQMALTPLLAGCGFVALTTADARYMTRDSDGVTIEQQVEEVQAAVNEIRTEQPVSNGEIGHLKDDIQEVKDQAEEINRKLDRLIERQ